MKQSYHFPLWFCFTLLVVLTLAVTSGCKANLDRLSNVKGKTELVVSAEIWPAAYQFSPDMTKVIFAFSEDGKENKRGFINLEGSKRRIELFADCECGVQDVRWLDNTFFVSDGRCHKCSFLVDSRDLTMTHLSVTLVRAPVEKELVALWKETDPLYYLPDFGNQDGWLLAPDGTASHFYSLSLAYYDRKELLAELGDTLISLERPVPPRKIFSPNGTMYAYTGATGEPVKVYSTDGEILAQAGPIRSQGSAWAFGWVPNGRAVYLSVYYPGFPNEAEPLFLLHLPEK